MKFYSSNTSVGFIELVKLETENESKTTKEQACQIFLHIYESIPIPSRTLSVRYFCFNCFCQLFEFLLICHHYQGNLFVFTSRFWRACTTFTQSAKSFTLTSNRRTCSSASRPATSGRSRQTPPTFTEPEENCRNRQVGRSDLDYSN